MLPRLPLRRRAVRSLKSFAAARGACMAAPRRGTVRGGTARAAEVGAFIAAESLEDRTLLTVDLILDFDGGVLRPGNGYEIPQGFANTPFSAFTAFARGDGSPGNRTEQILQVIAGVREDFAPFDARIIWDDAGVDSAFYDAVDTVVMITNFNGGPFGIASGVDTAQAFRDTALAFRPPHVGFGSATTRGTNTGELRELIDTISHEIGHTLGLSHSTERDAQQRQLVTTAGQDVDLDSRFSPQVLNHGGPENGVRYSEVERLNANIGAAAVVPNDALSGQTLPRDPTVGALSLGAGNQGQTTGSVDLGGDRDAHRFTIGAAGTYTLRQTAGVGSLLQPAVTLWNAGGDFLAAGTPIAAGTGSELTFAATAGQTFYAVAGSTFDRSMDFPGTPTTGDYTLGVQPEVAATGADLGVTINDGPDPIETGETVTYTVTVTNDGPAAVAGADLDNALGFPGGAYTVFGESLTFSDPGAATGSGTLAIEADGPNVTDLNLAAGASATLTFSVAADAGAGTITNTAMLSGGAPADPNASNDTAVATTRVDAPAAPAAGDVLFITDGAATPPPDPPNGRTREIIASPGQDLTIDVGSAAYPNGVARIILDRSAPALRSLTILGDDAGGGLRVTIEEGANAGNLSFTGGAGAETVEIDGAVRGLTFFGGAGDDRLITGPNGSVSSAGTVTVDGGAGDDLLVLANMTATRLNADAGDGDDTLSLTDGRFRGTVNLQAGGGGDVLTVTGVSARGSVGVNASRGDGGDDAVILTGVSAGNIVAVLTGGGDDTVRLSDLSGTRLNVNAGDGDDSLTLTDGRFRGTVNLQAGGGGDTVSLTTVTAGGSVGVNASRGAGGADTVTLDGVAVGGTIAVLTGADGDTVRLSGLSADRLGVAVGDGDDALALADGDFRGTVNLQAGGGGDEVTLTDVTALGNVGVNASRGGGGGSDRVSLDRVFAGNVMAVLTGSGADDLDLADVSARRYDLLLGAGDDDLDARSLTVRAGGRGANVQLGAGNDDATLNAAVAADSGIGVNGGDGDDRVNLSDSSSRRTFAVRMLAGEDLITATALTGFPFVLDTGSGSGQTGTGSFGGTRTFRG